MSRLHPPPDFFKLPKGSPTICNQQLCVSHLENQLFTLHVFCSHTHIQHSPSSSFSYTDLFALVSYTAACLHLFLLSHLLLFSPSLSFSHTYIQTYLHTTVFPHWSPFEKHLIRKAWDAHIPPLSHPPSPPHTPPASPFCNTNSSLLF